MSEKEIPKEVKDFVFHSIDSAEQLDIILLLYSHREQASIKDITDILRSTSSSIQKRLTNLMEQNLVSEANEAEGLRYSFNFENQAAAKLVASLAELYKSHRYGILEIIFSPLKKSRDFAEAFKISNSKDSGKGGRNG